MTESDENNVTRVDAAQADITQADVTQADHRPIAERQPTSIRLTDRYRIGALLGEGGMGEVRDCRDTILGRSVALKLVRADLSSASIEARFLQEACVQAQLEHTGVVPVYDVGWDQKGAAFFTMRKIEGITLDEVIRRKRADDPEIAPFTLHRLLGAFTKVCATIDHAHARGVLHRDLKPANVMLGDYGEVYVLDWGLAKIADAAPMSQRGETLGTPAYMAPEQLAGQAIDARADVFALGMILYEILTLSPLFDRKALEARGRGQLREWDARPTERNPDAPPEFDRICVRATAADVAKRYPSARALHDAVESWLAGERDEDLRAALAGEHLERAESLSKTEPREAMREVNRALALAPSDRRAIGLLVSLFQSAIAAPSPELRAEAAWKTMDRLRRAQPLGALLYGIWWVTFYPAAVAYRGVWSVPLAILIPVVWLLAAGAIYLDYVHKSQERVRYPTALVMTAVGLTSFLFGPLLLVPALAVTCVASHVLVGARHHRSYQTTLAALAVAVPLILSWTGVIDTLRFENETTFWLKGVFRTMRPVPATLGMNLVDLALLGATAFFTASFRDELERARRENALFVWQLRHLVPAPESEQERAKKANRPISDPLGRRIADTEIDRSTRRAASPGFLTELEGEGGPARAAFSGARYEEQEVLEEDDEAYVLRAHDRLVNRTVLMKRAKDGADDAFVREALVLARLDHPGVPPLYDFGRDERGRPWFTTEDVLGAPLLDATRRGRHRLLRAFAQVCLTIDLAHARGILHGALEPQAILLGDLDEVYVRSWRNASTHHLSDAEGPLALPPAKTTGARGYAAPEQAAGSPPDVRSDVFALGAILFEVLTGKPLFGHDRTDVVLGRYDARPSAHAKEDDPIASELDDICVRATAYDPADRHATARELYEAIDTYLARDRDETLRALLAEKHLTRATTQVGELLRNDQSTLAERVATLQEVGRALALSRDRGPARDLLERLIATPPKDLPPEVARDIAEQGSQAARRAYPMLAVIINVAWLVAFPIAGAIVGVRSVHAAMIVAAAWAIAAFALWLPRLWSDVAALLAASVTSLLFGPHILVPSIVVLITMGFILGGRIEWRRPLVVLAFVALIAPAMLNLAGVLDVFRFEPVPAGSTLTMTGVIKGALIHPPDLMIGGLLIANVVAVLVASAFSARFRDVLEDVEAQNRAKVHALASLVEK